MGFNNGNSSFGFGGGSTSGGGGGGLTQVTTTNTSTFSFYGQGTVGSPLCGCPQLSLSANQGILALGDGLWSPNPIRNGLVYGGVVTWLQNYDYSVSPAGYYINGVFYTSPLTTVTLPPADPSFDRIDLFVVTTSGTATSVTGTPANPPQAPTIDPNTQLDISFAVVTAGSVAPPITSQYIYLNNAEWTTSTTSGTINVASTNSPYSPPVDIEATNSPRLASVSFNTTPFAILTTYQTLIFYIRSKATWGSNRRLLFQWLSGGVGGTLVGTAVNLTGNSPTYAFDSSQTATYQRITIPLSDFGLNTASIVDTLTVQVSGVAIPPNPIGFFLDNIEIQSGNPQPSPSSQIYIPSLGACSTIRCAVGNQANSNFSGSLSGRCNLVGTSSAYSGIVFGCCNSINGLNNTGSGVLSGFCNNVQTSISSISSGFNNRITGLGSYGFIGNGALNCISTSTFSFYNTIINGRSNCITSNNAQGNTVLGSFNTISGYRSCLNLVSGINNTVCSTFTGSGYGTLFNQVFGDRNIINLTRNAQGNTLFGQCNRLEGCNRGHNFLIGRQNCIIDGGGFCDNSANLIGGINNRISGTFGVHVLFGTGNIICATSCDNYLYAAILSGASNRIENPRSSAIVTGQSNCIVFGAAAGLSGRSFIGGGCLNTITCSSTSSITSGRQNTINGSFLNHISITSGCLNTATANNSFIGGGVSNTVSNCVGAILSGCGNIANAIYSSVINGCLNTSSGAYATIINGDCNLAQASFGFIGNGVCNNLCNVTSGCLALGSVIVGGVGNNTTGGTWDLPSCSFTVAPTICNTGQYNFIGSGFQNVVVSSDYSSINSGLCNFITGTTQNAILTGSRNCICTASGGTGGQNTIINGFNNLLCTTSNTSNNNLLSGCCNVICGIGSRVNFIGGRLNCIVPDILATPSYSSPLDTFIFGARNIMCGSFGANIIVGTCNGICTTSGYQAGLGTFNTVFGCRNAFNNQSNSFVAGGLNCMVTTTNAFQKGSSAILGGCVNTLTESGQSAILGGFTNTMTNSMQSIIGAGCNNTASNCFTFLGGGCLNTTSGLYSVIINGRSGVASGVQSYIGNGCLNTSTSCQSFVGSGQQNQSIAVRSSILNGFLNCNCGALSSILGGQQNCILNANGFSIIAGGGQNTTSAQYGSIFGGSGNTASGIFGFVLNGSCNVSSGRVSSTLSGCCNTAQGSFSLIGNGICNNVFNSVSESTAFGSVVLSGVGNNTFGGTWDQLTCTWTVAPTVCNTGTYNLIGSGFQNIITGSYSFVGSGFQNIASGNRSSILGGQLNNTCGFADAMIIGSCINATQNCTTFVNCLSAGNLTVGCQVCVGSNGVLVDFAGGGGGGLTSVSTTNTTTFCFSGNGTVGTPLCGCPVLSACPNQAIQVCGDGLYVDCSSFNSAVIVLGSGGLSSVRCGANNVSSGCGSNALGGQCNTASGFGSAVVNGFKNLTQADYGFVGSGVCNNLCNTTSGCLALGSVVVGGVGNNTTGGTWDLATCTFTVAPTICNAGQYSFIGGGFQNQATGGCHSAVINGRFNTSSADFSFVANGLDVNAIGFSSFAGNGNCVISLGTYSFSGNGLNNVSSGFSSFTGNGCCVTTSGNFAFTGSGTYINTSGNCAITLSGNYIFTSGNHSFTGTGQSIITSGCYGFTANGCLNRNCSYFSTILNGEGNVNNATKSGVLGGGTLNYIGFSDVITSNTSNVCDIIFTGNVTAQFNVNDLIYGYNPNICQVRCGCVTGSSYASGCTTVCTTNDFGTASQISVRNITTGVPTGCYNTITNGLYNSIICGSNSIIIGGEGNKIDADLTLIGTGYFNSNSGNSSFIGSGSGNCILVSSPTGFIGGGISNCLCGTGDSSSSVIVGGSNNSMSNYGNTISFIGGGAFNSVSGYGANSVFIGGGVCNTISGCYDRLTSIVGGYYNVINNTVAFGSLGSVVVGGVGNNTTGGTWDGTSSFSVLPTSSTCVGCMSFIGSGFQNNVCGDYGSITGGSTNCALSKFSSIVGGQLNLAQGTLSFIGGGGYNNVCNVTSGCLALGSVVVGGIGNNTTGGTWDLATCSFTVAPTICTTGQYTFIGGGFQNRAEDCNSVAVGGFNNRALGLNSAILGGCNNCIIGSVTGNSSVIVGGFRNCVSCSSSFIGGGQDNSISQSFSSILAGNCNQITSTNGVIGGGTCNRVLGDNGVVLGGVKNCSTACLSATLSGYLNTSCGYGSGVLGGCKNQVQADYGFIGSGICNNVTNTTSCLALGTVVVGGIGNNTTGGTWDLATCSFTVAPTTTNSGRYSFIGGGFQNQVLSDNSVVVGGVSNIVSKQQSAIVGGFGNCADGITSFVGAGRGNKALGLRSTVVAGCDNTNNAIEGFIGAGNCNQTFNATDGCLSFGAVVVGGVGNNTTGGTFNLSSGSFTGGGLTVCNAGQFSFVGAGFQNRATGSYSVAVGGCNNTSSGAYSVVLGGESNTASNTYSAVLSGCSNTANGLRSTIIGGQLNNTCSFADAHIIGSNINATQSCTTFVNCLSAGNLTTGCFVCVASNGVISNVAPPVSYSLSMGYADTSLVASSTYFAGIRPDISASLSACASRRAIIPRSGFIEAVGQLTIVTGTKSSATPNVTMRVRNVTTATNCDYASDSFFSSGGLTACSRQDLYTFTGNGLQVTAGDIIEFQIITPAWVTAPVGTWQSYTVYINNL